MPYNVPYPTRPTPSARSFLSPFESVLADAPKIASSAYTGYQMGKGIQQDQSLAALKEKAMASLDARGAPQQVMGAEGMPQAPTGLNMGMLAPEQGGMMDMDEGKRLEAMEGALDVGNSFLGWYGEKVDSLMATGMPEQQAHLTLYPEAQEKYANEGELLLATYPDYLSPETLPKTPFKQPGEAPIAFAQAVAHQGDMIDLQKAAIMSANDPATILKVIQQIKGKKEQEAGYTLSPGQTRFKGGEEIASVPALAKETKALAPLKIERLNTLIENETDPVRKAEYIAMKEKMIAGQGLDIEFENGQVKRISRGAKGKKTRPPTGYKWTEEGEKLEVIPGGPADRQPPEQAAKTQLLEQGVREVTEFKKMLYKKDGSVDKQFLFNMAARIPYTDGRAGYSLIYDAIEAKLRAESGAAVPEPEVVRMAKRLVPDIYDNEKGIEIKMRLLEQFLRGARKKIGNIKSNDKSSVHTSPADTSSLIEKSGGYSDLWGGE